MPGAASTRTPGKIEYQQMKTYTKSDFRTTEAVSDPCVSTLTAQLPDGSLADAIDGRHETEKTFPAAVRSLLAHYARVTYCPEQILPMVPIDLGMRRNQAVVIVPPHQIHLALVLGVLRATPWRVTAFGPFLLRVESGEAHRDRTVIAGPHISGKVDPAGDPTDWDETYLKMLFHNVHRITVEPRGKRFPDTIWVGRPAAGARCVRILSGKRFVRKWAAISATHAPQAKITILGGPTTRTTWERQS